MPVVQISMLPRPVELKRKLLEMVTETVSKTLGIPKERVHVLIYEVPKENLVSSGKLATEMK